jgi:hypothetical protein
MIAMWFKPKNVSKLLYPMGSVSSALNSVYETKNCVDWENKRIVILNFLFETGVWTVSKICHLCAKQKEKRNRNQSRAEVKT